MQFKIILDLLFIGCVQDKTFEEVL
jgi:aspartate ammonia-lyase